MCSSDLSRRPSSKQLAYTEAIARIYDVPGLNYLDYPIFGLTDRGILYLLLERNGWARDAIASRELEFQTLLLDLH